MAVRCGNAARARARWLSCVGERPNEDWRLPAGRLPAGECRPPEPLQCWPALAGQRLPASAGWQTAACQPAVCQPAACQLAAYQLAANCRPALAGWPYPPRKERNLRSIFYCKSCHFREKSTEILLTVILTLPNFLVESITIIFPHRNPGKATPRENATECQRTPA